MHEGPTLIKSCYKCKWRRGVYDWRDGDYDNCSHPRAEAVAPKHFPYTAVYDETPKWCPIDK